MSSLNILARCVPSAIPKVLDLLDLENKVITINAMGPQQDICQQILKGQEDYVITLKGNQGTLYEDEKLYLQDLKNREMTHETNDKGHGRLEQRVAVVTHDITWLNELHPGPGLKAIGQITVTVWKKAQVTQEIRYYIFSLTLEAARLNDIACKHWAIENQLHWSLDGVFNENKACLRNDNVAENRSILRK